MEIDKDQSSRDMKQIVSCFTSDYSIPTTESVLFSTYSRSFLPAFPKKLRQWWGRGREIISWNPEEEGFDWEPCVLSCCNDWFRSEPILDGWCLPGKLRQVECNVFKTYSNRRNGDNTMEELVNVFPAICYYRRPYFEMMQGRSCEAEVPVLGISLDIDAFFQRVLKLEIFYEFLKEMFCSKKKQKKNNSGHFG